MHTIDIVIIILYLLTITGVGLYISRRSGDTLGDYFLGGRSIPWYILGISGMANFIDMGGTAYQSGWYFLIGAKGFWLAIEGAVSLLLSFQMIYAAKWLRRSDCLTNAQWMVFRFGKETDGQLARITSALGALAICVGLMSFFFVGAAKVLPTFLPFFTDWFGAGSAGNVAALAFFILVGAYTITSGFKGVIYTDLFQAGLILFLILYIAWRAFSVGTPEYFAQHAPEGWLELFPKDGWGLSLPEAYTGEGFEGYVEKAMLLGSLLILWGANNIFMGLATPFDAWTAQRYYATRNEREASLTVMQWIVTWSLRFLLLAGIGILALGVKDQITHPENALSVVVQQLVPVGIQGLLLAALLAAGMSTIDSTANSSASYFVKDIYQPFINPDADNKQLMRMSHLTTFVLMASGVAVGWLIVDVNAIWGWIITGLFVGALPPNIAKWFWSRTSGFGYMAGTAVGLAAALGVKLVPALAELSAGAAYLTVFGSAAIATVLGSLLRPNREPAAVQAFFETTRPFGFWRRQRAACDEPTRRVIRAENMRDLVCLPIACIWHLSLFLMLSCLMFRNWVAVIICLGTFAVTGVCLYFLWYRHLGKHAPAPAQ